MTVHSFNGSEAAGLKLISLMDSFKELFNRMEAGRIGDLNRVYHPQVEFQDPFTAIHGRHSLAEYFQGAYRNVLSCRFQFGDLTFSGGTCYLPWTMTVCHRRLRRGHPIVVEGVSQIRVQDGLIVWHRDYFDASRLVYEHVPVLGAAVRWIRRHAV
ncbi:MAG: nuclear transport factor 2 family protein [Marinobacter sp.]|uniref:nuclear transport factor 2 family protein n=1 Tax=Marinobacter sp. TaxID=50741 RepID=UPI00299D8938|nr:nuclear transport factor 2 family protein [Marinobacter sp.]MDX1755017.1 nuclear transport factor 2 family protein [Marinobacter sp.]